MEAQVQDYNKITEIFRKNKIKYDEKKLKYSVIYNKYLDPDMDKRMRTQGERYPGPEVGLMINAHRKPKKEGKKKKKK